MHIIKYNKYPNNEIRVTHYYRANRPEVQLNDEGGIVAHICSAVPSDSEGVLGSSLQPSLDISTDFFHPPKSSERKRTKFGANAKNTILRIGGAYDTIDATPSNYVFLTGTIPGGTHEAFKAMGEESSYVTESIAKWLHRTCPTDHWFYVWELQKRGALHIHYCLHCPDTTIREKVISSWRDKWESVLEGVESRAATDMWVRADGSYHREGRSVLQAYAQEVRKSVAAYMSGYCSNAKDKHTLDSSSPYYPTRWWGASRKSTNLLKGLTEEVLVEHTNYRDAHHQMLTEFERISADTDHCHRYPHKVGMGSTIVSYHPEDKGYSTWNQLQPMKFKTTTHPNTCSMIAGLLQWVKIYLPYLRVLKKPKDSSLPLLLKDLEELVSLGSLSRYTVRSEDIRTVLLIPSVLSFNAMENRIPERTRLMCIAVCWSWHQSRSYLRYDRQGWLNLENDLPIRLTDCPSLAYIGTNDPKESDGTLSGGLGSSASTPSDSSPKQLCLFSDS